MIVTLSLPSKSPATAHWNQNRKEKDKRKKEILMIDRVLIHTEQFNPWLKTKLLPGNFIVDQYASLPFAQRPVIKVNKPYLDVVYFLFHHRKRWWITSGHLFPENSNTLHQFRFPLRKQGTHTKKCERHLQRGTLDQHMKISKPWICRLGSFRN